jgi:hypothetical protein
VTDPLDDLPDDPPAAWDVEGPAFGRRPAAVEPLRDELLRYVAAPEVVSVASGDLEAWRAAEQ